MEKRGRIEIKSYQDLLDIIEDMFTEFAESIFDNDKYTHEPNDDSWMLKEEGITRLWHDDTLLKRYLARMEKVFIKYFPENEFKVYCTYYREW